MDISGNVFTQKGGENWTTQFCTIRPSSKRSVMNISKLANKTLSSQQKWISTITIIRWFWQGKVYDQIIAFSLQIFLYNLFHATTKSKKNCY